MGTLRCWIQQKKTQKFDSFEKVKSFFDKIAADMIETTYKTSLVQEDKPNSVGEDDNHWDNLYKTVALAYLQNRR